jgi:hypothetical protein
MAINEQDLHDLVYDALLEYSQGDYQDEMMNPQHMKVMGDTMKDYFEANIEVAYSWSATNPSSGAPDPVASFVSEVSFPAFDLAMPMSLSGLAVKIVGAFQGACIKHPGAWSVPSGIFNILQLALPQSPGADVALMCSIIHPVCEWAKALINPVPLSGSHAAFVGAATMASIN